MRIGVIGAGAMGSVFGGTLAEAGNDVALIDTRADHVDAINDGGLRLSGVGGDRTIGLRAAIDPEMVGTVDLALITVDSNNTPAAAETAARILGPDNGTALTLQNGIGNVEALVSRLGPERVVAGVTHHSGAILGLGHAAHTHAKRSWIGELDGSRSDRIMTLAHLFEASGHEIEIVDDPMGWIWSKFVLNCAINALCASTGLRAGHAARVPELVLLQEKVTDEALRVVEAKGITLADSEIRRTIRITTFTKYNKPSMLQHVEAGRRTEIDALNGALVREAESLGLAAPYNQAVVAIIKGQEQAALVRAADPPPDFDALEEEATQEAIQQGLLDA